MMIARGLFGRTRFAAIAAAVLILFVASCSSNNNHSDEKYGGEGGGSSQLAVSAFVYVASQAAEENCEHGDTSACKIAFAVDPNYKSQYTAEQIKSMLNKMADQLSSIETQLTTITGLLDNLSTQLNISVADLKLDNAQSDAAKYMHFIQAAFNALRNDDFSDAKIDPKLYVSSAMTNNVSTNPWDVPSNLEQLHLLIVDPTSTGLFTKMGDYIETKWQGQAPSYDDAINTYLFMENYFGYLLTEEGKGLSVVAACYNYLSIYPDADISSHLLYKDFNSFVKYSYKPMLEKQIQVFLQHVESYIAAVSDVDKPGEDSSTQKKDIKSWTSVVLKRADLMAAWARTSLNNIGATSSGTPVLLTVRIIGEPDRSTLLYNNGPVKDETSGKQYGIDKSCLGSDGNTADYRQWPTRKPYIQFPLHPEAAQGSVLSRGAIKGANSFYMLKYVLTDNDLKSVQTGQRVINLPDWLGDVIMTVDKVGPDGNAPQTGGQAMLFGHATIVLKEAAARRGIWTIVTPADITNDSIDNLTKTHGGTVRFPHDIELHVYADPHASTKSTCDPIGDCWNQYYIYGDGYFNVKLQGLYHFEGWGDVPASKIQTLITGKKTDTIDESLSAKNGSYSMELLYSLLYGSNTFTSSKFTDQGNVTLAVQSSDTLPEGDVTVTVEPRIKLYWNKSKSDNGFGTCTFAGTTDFRLGSLVFQVM